MTTQSVGKPVAKSRRLRVKRNVGAVLLVVSMLGAAATLPMGVGDWRTAEAEPFRQELVAARRARTPLELVARLEQLRAFAELPVKRGQVFKPGTLYDPKIVCGMVDNFRTRLTDPFEKNPGLKDSLSAFEETREAVGSADFHELTMFQLAALECDGLLSTRTLWNWSPGFQGQRLAEIRDLLEQINERSFKFRTAEDVLLEKLRRVALRLEEAPAVDETVLAKYSETFQDIKVQLGLFPLAAGDYWARQHDGAANWIMQITFIQQEQGWPIGWLTVVAMVLGLFFVLPSLISSLIDHQRNRDATVVVN